MMLTQKRKAKEMLEQKAVNSVAVLPQKKHNHPKTGLRACPILLAHFGVAGVVKVSLVKILKSISK